MSSPHCVDQNLRASLTAFAPSVEGSSLYLLRAINETVDSFQAMESLASGVAQNAHDLVNRLTNHEHTLGQILDPDDAVISALEAGYKALEEQIPELLVRKRSIDEDRDLKDDQRELLHTAYDRYIDAAADLIESTKQLRALVIKHDLAAEGEPTEKFDSPEALIASLNSTA